jgi:ADP-heptose:LPS heptosyltransferase
MTSNNRTIAADCRHFLGDRPCVWHKRHGVVCECEHYERVTGRLLLIKLDAMGDVLRTTCLLPVLRRAWPGHSITWITRPDSVPLLRNNPLIDEIVPYGPDATVQLAVRRFDRVINLDAGRTSAALASMARAGDRIGYLLDEHGGVIATNAAAEEWLRMGVYDDLKKANVRTYQEIMCRIVGVEPVGLAYVLELTPDEIRTAETRLQGMGIDRKKPIVGIHSGGGGRWRMKQWSEGSFRELIQQIVVDSGGELQVMLFGGPLERTRNRRLMEAAGVTVFDAGCDNDVRHFAALVKACAVLLSGDSLAMHVALAVGTRTVVLFGPTSHAEIELFSLGEKVIPDLSCLVCYKTDCDFVPNCMDSISVSSVKRAILRQLEDCVGPSGRSRSALRERPVMFLKSRIDV